MFGRGFYLSVALVSLLCFGLTLPVQGGDAKIRDILIAPSKDRIVLYARVSSGFTKDMESSIVAGVPANFTFLLNLHQERSYWFDREIASITVVHTLKYDIVKKIFTVTSSDGQAPAVFQDFESAKAAMGDLSGVAIAAMKDLVPNQTYYVRMKARLDKVRLPLHMEYVFFFVSWWDFETDWYMQKFVYRK